MSQNVVERAININATPARVWDALTDPEKTKKYFFHCEVHSDWKVGSPITFNGKMFWVIDIEMKGEILEIVPNELLKYRLKNGKDGAEEGYSVVTDTLTYKAGITTLSISDDVGDAEGWEKRLERSEKGWEKVLDGLKELVEEGE